MLLLLDNHDSFTYNLAGYFETLGQSVAVHLSDALSVADCLALNPSHIVISPGPGRPADAGISIALIQHARVPVLGVCLGHQCMASAYGGRIRQAKHIKHGKQSRIEHNGEGIFNNIPTPFCVTRYHSLAIDPNSPLNHFHITATTSDNEIMAIQHTSRPLFGVQFHPEALLTEHGHQLLENFLSC